MIVLLVIYGSLVGCKAEKRCIYILDQKYELRMKEGTTRYQKTKTKEPPRFNVYFALAEWRS